MRECACASCVQTCVPVCACLACASVSGWVNVCGAGLLGFNAVDPWSCRHCRWITNDLLQGLGR